MQLSAGGVKMSGMTGIRSIMQDIAAATADGGRWLNLSPGNPARIAEVDKTWQRLAETAVVDAFPASAAYGPSRGAPGLVDAIVRQFRARYGWDIGPRNVVVAAGAQLLTFMTTTIFTGRGPAGHRPLVLPCTPDYTGYHGLPLDHGGIVGVEPVIDVQPGRYFRYRLDAERLRGQPEMGMLLVSNPANPTGRGLTSQEMDTLIDVATERDVPLVIDNAYGEPFPRVGETPSGLRLHPNVINLFTASKAGIPGERIAFAIADPEIVDTIVAFVANVALHAPLLIQSLLQRAIEEGALETLASEVIRPYYRRKRRIAEELLIEHLPATPRWRMHATDGGMFCWLWFDDQDFSDLAAYQELKRRNVFVVPGRHFFVSPSESSLPDGHATRCLRLSLGPEVPVLAEGIARIGAMLRDEAYSE